ncbi:MAG: glycogen synthase [Acholeplasmataceae bacterium]|nr:glycogen synthase [Acholeplasmataceae bacterium]
MKILFCTGEAFPFSKSGGLADVSAALPKAIKALNHDIRIITPLYGNILNQIDNMKYLGKVEIQLADFYQSAEYYETVYDNVSYVFVRNDNYFNRDKMYGHHDDAERFTFFSKACIEFIDTVEFYPDIIHVNDWQTGVIPYLIEENYRHKSNYFKRVKTLLSIHNLEYQGAFDIEVDKFFNTKFNYTYIHFDRVNFLKCGIMRAHYINTVSPNYRNEILTRFYGFTLDGALKARDSRLIGILNGIDYNIYNPETDNKIVANYNNKHFIKAKKANKLALVEKLGLDKTDNLPLIASIGRLARQKGIDLMKATLEETIQETNALFVLIGSGDPQYEEYFAHLAAKYPRKVYAHIGFDEDLAHLTYAASDLFMMPSLFEPCGLGQMISQRYGSLPVVRETGGLKDTVNPYNKYTGEGNGFSFANYNAHEFKDSLEMGIDLFHNNQRAWRQLVKQAMSLDRSLNQMGLDYIDLYKRMMEKEK